MATTKQFLLLVIFGLCMCSLTCGLPLPRLVYQQETRPSMFWEARPAADTFTALADLGAARYTSYLEGRFDPDRPYIQMIVPNTDDMAAAAKKPNMRPTKPTPDDRVVTLPDEDIIPCGNLSSNGTIDINGTDIFNATNSTEYCNKTIITTPALLMLADGITLYGRQEGGNPSLNGAYELAYVAHQPSYTTSVRPALYPLVQYVDYNQLPWDVYGVSPFGGSPLYSSTAGLYQPVYIYKPVFPVTSRNYDVYYYFPTDREDQSNAVLQNKATTKSLDSAVQEAESRLISEAEGKTHELIEGSEKEEAKETPVPNVLEETDREEQALDNALNSKIKQVIPFEEKGIETHEGMLDEQDDGVIMQELDRISSDDLLEVVERVLQQLHSRLIAK